MFYRLGLLAVRWRFGILAAWLVVVLAACPSPRVSPRCSPLAASVRPTWSRSARLPALEQGLHTSFTSVARHLLQPTLTADDPHFQAEATPAVAGLQSWDEVSASCPSPWRQPRSRRTATPPTRPSSSRADADNAPKVLPELNRRLVAADGPDR